jgi:hypothetical protein
MGQQQDSVDSQEAFLSVFQSLTKVLKDKNQHLQSSDVTEPTKFNGLDTQWDDFYLQLRTYLEAKGWLTTFDHKDGPGTAGFNTEINKKIYNKLLALCRKGTAHKPQDDKMPSDRMTAIQEVQADILSNSKKTSYFTNDTTRAHINSLHLDDFNRFNRLKRITKGRKIKFERAIKACMDGHQLASRQSQYQYHYRLFADYLEIFQIELHGRSRTND